jgi:uncharacterized protein
MLSLCFALVVPGPTPVGAVSQSAPLTGLWEGAIQVSGVTLQMRVVFTGADGALTAAIDIPQQGASGVPLRNVTRNAAGVHFELPTGGAAAIFDGTLDGDRITGTFTQGAASGQFTLTRAKAEPPPPYAEHEVTFTNGSISLAGTLSVPQGAGPFPAVVLLTGSGPQNRDEEILGFKVFRVIADHLTRHGIAVLRHDDRGVGTSTGNIAQATTADFAGDALAAVALLRARPDIVAGKVGLFGHSEGAAVASIAAARSTDVAFIVLLAGTGVRGDAVLRQQAADGARALGASDAAVDRILAAHRAATAAVLSGVSDEAATAAVRALIEAQIDGLPPAQQAAVGDREAYVARRLAPNVASMRSPWMRFMLDFDPATPLARVSCPVLAIFGDKDTQVPPSLNRAPVERALAGNARATVKLYPDANHLFQKAQTGLVTEYAGLDKAFVPGLLDDVTQWITSVTGG